MDITAITIEVSKLSFKRGDILAIRADRLLSKEQISRMQIELEKIAPDGVKVAVLDSTCELIVVEQPNAK